MLVSCSSYLLFLAYKLQLRLAREHRGKGIRHVMQIQIRGNYMFFQGNALKAYHGLKKQRFGSFSDLNCCWCWTVEPGFPGQERIFLFSLNPIVVSIAICHSVMNRYTMVGITIEKMLHLPQNNLFHLTPQCHAAFKAILTPTEVGCMAAEALNFWQII